LDIIGGLTAAKLAVDLAKDLRQIDRSVDEATYKLKLADLTSALADMQLALTDAKLQIAELERSLASTNLGDLCPLCKTGRLKVTEVKPHRSSGILEWHTSNCDQGGCDYSNQRLFNTGSGHYVIGDKK
jgi:hypothetical protein